MRSSILCAALVAISAVPAVAFAQDAAPAPAAAALTIKPGTRLVSADGRAVGRIERVDSTKTGTPTNVAVITDNKFVYIPVSTLSAGEKGLVTTLTIAEIRKR